MGKRRLVVGGLLVGFLALILSVVWLLREPPIRPGVTLENFRHLHRGMTEAEIETIFGRPGDKRTELGDCHFTYWKTEDCDVWICFWNQMGGRARGGTITNNDGSDEDMCEAESPLDKLREWLGLK
jgi:hypothetical protein